MIGSFTDADQVAIYKRAYEYVYPNMWQHVILPEFLQDVGRNGGQGCAMIYTHGV